MYRLLFLMPIRQRNVAFMALPSPFRVVSLPDVDFVVDLVFDDIDVIGIWWFLHTRPYINTICFVVKFVRLIAPNLHQVST